MTTSSLPALTGHVWPDPSVATATGGAGSEQKQNVMRPSPERVYPAKHALSRHTGQVVVFFRIRIAEKISTAFPDGRLGQIRENSARGQTGSALCPCKLHIPTDISPDSIRKEL